MPADRSNRDLAASAIAAYMRREIDNFALDDRLHEIRTDDSSLREIRFVVWCLYDDIKQHQVHGDRATWDLLRRVLAFLKSDCELPPSRRKTARRRWAGLFCLILLSVGVFFACTARWWWYFVFSALAWAGVKLRDELFPDMPDDPTLEYAPFSSQQDWLAHEPLLESEHLPPFDPAIHDRRLRGRLSQFMGQFNGIVLGVVLIPVASLFGLLTRSKSRSDDQSNETIAS